jgi:glycosyltransferase involved in cell wall biosynthesis
MHILYIHQYFATPRGHTGTRSYEFARRWVAAGHRVTMLTSVAQLTQEDLAQASGRLIRRFCLDGIEMVALNVPYQQRMGFVRRTWSFLLFMVLASWMVLRIKDVDLIYGTSTPLTVGIPALMGRYIRRRRYVFEVRDVWPAVPIAMGVIQNRLMIGALKWFERLVYRKAEAVVALSPGMEASVRKSSPPGRTVVVAPNCCDTDTFRPDVDGGQVRQARGWQDRFVCMHVGAIGPTNGLMVLVRAARHFRDSPEYLFVLVGDGSERPAICAEIERLQLRNIEVIDTTPKHEIPALLAAADLSLVVFANVPILEDNSANKFFDSLSAGRPVLLNYGGWQQEVIETAGAGWGCKQGDEVEFFAKIKRIKEDPELRRRMGQAARRLALERFSRDRLAAKVLHTIIQAASSKPTRS